MPKEQLPHENELIKYMRRISHSNRWDQVAFRGCTLGIFSALGASVGVAFVLLILGNLVAGVKDVPFFENILAQTKLDVLIEKQISDLSGLDEEPTGNTSNKPVVYQDKNIGLQITYPGFLNNAFNSRQNSADKEYHLVAEGFGVLNSLEIYFNEDPQLVNMNEIPQQYEATVANEKVIFEGFYDGYEIENVTYDNAVFVFKKEIKGNIVTFIGIASDSTPRIGREVYRQVLESIKLL